jgi:ATP-binding cassette subfamily C protein/ATP-binding cassette subfamily C protein LapB
MTAVLAEQLNNYGQPAGLAETLDIGRLGSFTAMSDVAVCLMPLLSALGWRGKARQVTEALPHFANNLDLSGLRNVLAHLGYDSRGTRLRLANVDPRMMPSLFVSDRGKAMVVLGRGDDGIEVFDGGAGQRRVLQSPKERGAAYFFSPRQQRDAKTTETRQHWFRRLVRRFGSTVYRVLGITLALNLLALATPLFIMAVYDWVISAKSLSTLGYLALGVLLALICDQALRAVRARVVAYVGARLDMIVGSAVFEHVLHLPPAFTEHAPVGAQVARLKEFESLREFFTGPLALVVMELPFAIVFLVAVAFLGGPLAFIPIVLIALFLAVGTALTPAIHNRVSAATRTGSNRQSFLVEATSNMRALKFARAEQTWLERYRVLSADAAAAGMRSSFLAATVTTLVYVMMLGAGVATLGFGTFRVLDGAMSVGALVATMILVWRVLSPLQTGFITLTRLEQVLASIRQLNRLMAIRPEREPNTIVPPRQYGGRVTFSRVSLRYAPDSDPALIGVNFDVAPGEIVAVIGHNGSGKSTLLKVISGLYAPQAGNVRIDGLDIRQLDPVELRHAVGYVPQVGHLFHGTIAQNLRLGEPTASDENLRRALQRAHVLEDILALPEGLETRIGDQRSRQLPSGLRQRLCLARCYLREAPIMLFDEPANALDRDGDRAFMTAIEEFRGRATAFIVTHRPSHMRLADRVLVLDHGVLRFAGPPEEVLAKLPEGFV